jgi:hypothetical protein
MSLSTRLRESQRMGEKSARALRSVLPTEARRPLFSTRCQRSPPTGSLYPTPPPVAQRLHSYPCTGSRPCGLRTMVTDPSRAVCIVYISRSAVLEPYFPPVVQLVSPTPEHPLGTHPRISTRTVSQTVWDCGHGGTRESHTSCNDQT